MRRTTRVGGVAVGLALAAVFGLAPLRGEDKKPSYPKHPDAKNVKVMPDAWKSLSAKPASGREIDQLLAQEHKIDKVTPSPLTSDEQFIRRVTLDLTGKLPLPADVQEFIDNKESTKRAKLIDRLLASDDFARHWARYWKDVVVSRATDMRTRRVGQGFEEWLFEQFKANKQWDDIARDIITAEGEFRFGEPGKNGQAYFLLAHTGNEAANERAAETSRVFLGIQIQCAQCHDHPNDIWKREQFHQLAAFFARTRERRLRDGALAGFELTGLPRGEHQMPDMNDPKKTTTIQPAFLTGQKVQPGKSDGERRKALADYVTAKDNYWFAAAFVNRVWGELMGQAFYQPVDSMGPLQEATFPNVLLRLSASFRAADYDVKHVFRTIMNSEAYQRVARLGDSPDEHLHFTAAYPTRLRADSLWDSLTMVLGPMQGPAGFGRKPPVPAKPGIRVGLQGQFMETFEFDPSTKSDEVEGSVPQALLLMNNTQINERIKATGDTVLARILKAYPEDNEAIKMLYLRSLARKPTARELETCREYLKSTSNRNEAFEDILWSLINSTEFQTKR